MSNIQVRLENRNKRSSECNNHPKDASNLQLAGTAIARVRRIGRSRLTSAQCHSRLTQARVAKTGRKEVVPTPRIRRVLALQERSVLAIWVAVNARHGRQRREQFLHVIFLARCGEGHSVIASLLDADAGFGGAVPRVGHSGVRADLGVDDHRGEVVRAVVVWTCAVGFERLVAVGADLVLVDPGEEFFDGGFGAGHVADEDLQSGELGEVEAAVVAREERLVYAYLIGEVCLLGRGLLLESHLVGSEPSNILLHPRVQSIVQSRSPLSRLALPQKQNPSRKLTHTLQIEDTRMASLLRARPTEQLSIYEVRIHKRIGVDKPGIDRRSDVSRVGRVFVERPGEGVVENAVGHGLEGTRVVDHARVGVEFTVAADVGAHCIDWRRGNENVEKMRG